MIKLVIYKDIGPAPEYTQEIKEAYQMRYTDRITPEQLEMIRQHQKLISEYQERLNARNHRACPNCGSFNTYGKAKGMIQVCRKCCTEAEVEIRERYEPTITIPIPTRLKDMDVN